MIGDMPYGKCKQKSKIRIALVTDTSALLRKDKAA